MIIGLSKVVSWATEKGNLAQVTDALGRVIWARVILDGGERFSYVSLGDSIAVGHRIDENWLTDYGWDAQCGVGGRTHTTLVPGCYTDILRQELENIYGKNHVTVNTFAKSGDTVEDLIEKLTAPKFEAVQNAVKEATLVTICICANNVLDHALSNLESYLMSGDISNVDRQVADAMDLLNNDNDANSVMSLLKKLNELNPNAKYVFTTVYNPYKHLHLVEGSQKGSFLYPILKAIPSIEIDVDREVEKLMEANGYGSLLNHGDLGYWDLSNVLNPSWVSIEMGIDLGQVIRDGLANTSAVKALFKNINAMGTHAEGYIDGNDRFLGINPILRSKLNSYKATHPNFMLAETKKLFDLFPSRTNAKDDVDYSDLVNVEFAESYDVEQMDWDSLWKPEHDTFAGYFIPLALKHLKIKTPSSLSDMSNLSTDPWSYVEYDIEALANELIADLIPRVIEPRMDPHPEHHGHQVLKRSFTNVLGLTRYVSNGGGYVAGDVVLNGGNLTLPEAVKTDYVFGGWYTDKELQKVVNPYGGDFVDYQASHTLADLVSGNTVIAKPPKVTPLYAKWLEPNQIILKNIVPPMDTLSFEVRSSSGTCEMSIAHSKYGSTALCNTGVSGYNEMYAMSTMKFNLIPDHIYYACVEVYQEEKLGSVDFFWPSGSPSMFGGKIPGDAGTWKKWDNVTNRSTFAAGEYPIRLDFNNGGTAGKMWYDGLMLIDLTEAFGAGNEPTYAWCTENIQYFTGATTLYTP